MLQIFTQFFEPCPLLAGAAAAQDHFVIFPQFLTCFVHNAPIHCMHSTT